MTTARFVLKCACRAQNWINCTQPLERPAKVLLRAARKAQERAWWALRRVSMFARSMERRNEP